MKPKYKIIQTQAPHCPVCGDHLYQTNSLVSPWKCKCGTWKYDMEKIEYEIINPKDKFREDNKINID